MRFAGRLLGLPALLLGLLGATGPTLPLHQFVAHMRAAAGEPYKYHLVATAHERVEGVDVTLRTDYFGLAFSTRVCQGTLCTGTFFDGHKFFAINLNGTALPDSSNNERFIRGLRTINSGIYLSPEFEHGGGSLIDLGIVQYSGRTFRAVGVNAVDAQPLTMYVDPSSYLVTYVRNWDGAQLFENRDFRRVGALLLPFALYQDGNPYQRYDTREIDGGPFSPPRGLAMQLNGAPLPLTMLTDSNSPVIPCTLNGIGTRCLIDTGNSGFSISLELAEKLRLPSVGAFEVRGLGHYATEVVRAGPLQVGTAFYPQANYIVLHDIHRYGYDVVLGADALASLPVTIDYSNRSVTFGEARWPDGATQVPISFSNFVPILPVHLGDTVATLALDTGDESTINLAYEFYREHPQIFSATEARSVSGVGGSSEELIGEIPSVRVGAFSVESQRIGTTRSLRATAQGHLGAGFLEHFRVMLDYAHARILLQPRAGDPAVLPATP
ncbi:MAG: hypothetical protein DLM50_01545 [Candidatus Meridianibacter frigidus]|nr:MAG: hypothetical protein DLM50_01545 [Candidatus Eremiobacteraeota bacterium]